MGLYYNEWIGFALKHAYFTSSSIRQKSVDLLQQLAENLSYQRVPFDPRRSALLVLDVQRYFLEPESHAFIPSAPAILPGIRQLLEAYRNQHLPIVLTQHLNSEGDAGVMSSWWRDLITVENPLSEIEPEIQRLALSDQRSGNMQISKSANQQSTIFIQKSQYDAFYRTQLEEILHAAGTAQVVICGVMTHLCCETTARSAFVRGFEVFFTVDGTATYNEHFHLASLLNLAHGFAVPVLVEEILASIEACDDQN